MHGPPMKVHFKKEALKTGIRPKKVYTASQTPLYLKPAAAKVLAEATLQIFTSRSRVIYIY